MRLDSAKAALMEPAGIGKLAASGESAEDDAAAASVVKAFF